MSWATPIQKAASEIREVWDTNEKIQEAWEQYISKRGAKNTQRNLRLYVGALFRDFGHTLVTTLERRDIENFVEHISKKCKRLMLSDPPQCLWKHPISICPLIQGEVAPPCPDYQALQPSGVKSYVVVVNQFYNWLVAEGRISYNPAYPVMKDFLDKNKNWFEDRQRKPKKRHFGIEEIRALITKSPIQHGIVYMLMAKCFLREHEAHKLVWSKTHCNLEEGWMDIPEDWELGGKRLGNHRIILDAEMKHWLHKYRIWWEDKVKRDENGEPLTDRVVLTQNGMPWGKNGLGNFNAELARIAIRLGLQEPGREVPREERVQSHSFRAFSSTWAREAPGGCSTADLQTLRGDLSPGAIIRYDDYLKRLPELYQRFAPVLGL